jgi:hypothetical protein
LPPGWSQADSSAATAGSLRSTGPRWQSNERWAELAALARAMQPGGSLYLVFEGAHDGRAAEIAPRITANLERHGFAPEVVRSEDAGMFCVIGRSAASLP